MMKSLNDTESLKDPIENNRDRLQWQNNPTCVDTFTVYIYIYNMLTVQVFNVFAPNKDDTNDLFVLTFNTFVFIDFQILIAGKMPSFLVKTVFLRYIWKGEGDKRELNLIKSRHVLRWLNMI